MEKALPPDLPAPAALPAWDTQHIAHFQLEGALRTTYDGIKALQSPEIYGDAEAQLLGVGVLQAPPHWPRLDPGISCCPSGDT